MDWTPYIGPIVTALIAAGGTYAAVSAKLARLETALTDLRRDVEKHNNVLERVYKLESDNATAFHRIDELRSEQHDIRDDLHYIKIGGTK